MAAYNKIQQFVQDICEKIHDLSVPGDQLAVALTSSANPPLATNSVLSDLTEINYANLSSRNLTKTDSSQTAGTYALSLQDLVLTASGGSVAGFQHVVIYNSTAPNGPLICWYINAGGDIVLQDGETLTIQFEPRLFTLT